MICAYCGKDHSWLYCRTKPEGWKPPKKSTAPRKDVASDAVGPAGRSSVGRANAKPVAPVPFKAIPFERTSENQASPVDTHLGRPRMEGPSQGKSKRAAEMRDYMRKRRAKLKAP